MSFSLPTRACTLHGNRRQPDFSVGGSAPCAAIGRNPPSPATTGGSGRYASTPFAGLKRRPATPRLGDCVARATGTVAPTDFFVGAIVAPMTIRRNLQSGDRDGRPYGISLWGNGAPPQKIKGAAYRPTGDSRAEPRVLPACQGWAIAGALHRHAGLPSALVNRVKSYR